MAERRVRRVDVLNQQAQQYRILLHKIDTHPYSILHPQVDKMVREAEELKKDTMMLFSDLLDFGDAELVLIDE